MTVRDLIHSSLRLLGVLASGEAADAPEAYDALAVLQQVLDSASLDRLAVYVVERQEVPLVPGKRVYTWGLPGGDLAMARPVRLEGAVLRLEGLGYEYPLEVVAQPVYEAQPVKSQGSRYPSLVYLETSYPLARLYLWPVPTEANTLGLLPWVPLTPLATFEQVVSFPAGYARWLRAALAVELAPEYGKEPSPTLVGMLAEARAQVKRMNTVVPALGMDPAARWPGARRWDVSTDHYHYRRNA